MTTTVQKSVLCLIGMSGLALVTGCGGPQTEPGEASNPKQTSFREVGAEAGITHHMEEVETPASVKRSLHGYAVTDDGLSPEVNGINWALVANVGKAVWDLIEEDKPVVNLEYDYATGLPDGVSDAGDLAGFSDLQHRSFRLYGENGFGITVYDVTFTLVHQYGGHYDGKGRYLATVGVIPSQVDVLWGYDLSAKTTEVSTVNVGTEDNPVASVTMSLRFNVKTVMKDSSATSLFQFRGDRARVQEVRP